jgi:spermidine/putrescine transport system substrate-binding protein
MGPASPLSPAAEEAAQQRHTRRGRIGPGRQRESGARLGGQPPQRDVERTGRAVAAPVAAGAAAAEGEDHQDVQQQGQHHELQQQDLIRRRGAGRSAGAGQAERAHGRGTGRSTRPLCVAFRARSATTAVAVSFDGHAAGRRRGPDLRDPEDSMKLSRTSLAAGLAIFSIAIAASAQDNRLRLLTWSDYVPADVIADFKKETGIDVELTLSNNEEMISKLRATGGAGFDLAQPSQDRIAGPQQEFGIYKPMDLGKIKSELFIPSMLDATKKNTTLDGKVYGLPHIWGTDGLVVNTKLAQIMDYPDLCKAEYKGKTSMRLKRPTLLAFAFASGKDPFALYKDPKAYAALMDDMGKKLIECKGNIKFFWDNKDQLLNGMRTKEIVGAMMWDTGGWKLNDENPDIRYLAPRSGALGWIDTFALPAKGRNDAAAYAWINFNMRPEIAARVAKSAGNFTASNGAEQLMDAKLKAQFAQSFPEAQMKNIKWYPAVPPGIEDIEGKVLDRVKAAN